MYKITKLYQQYYVFIQFMKTLKKSALGFLLCFPTSFLALLLILLFTYTGLSVFCINPSFPAISSPEADVFPPENLSVESVKLSTSSSSSSISFSTSTSTSTSTGTSSVMYVVKEEDPPAIPMTSTTHLQKTNILSIPISKDSTFRRKTHRRQRINVYTLPPGAKTKTFSANSSPEVNVFPPENLPVVKQSSSSISFSTSTSTSTGTSSFIYVAKEEDPPQIPMTTTHLQKTNISSIPIFKNSTFRRKKHRKQRLYLNTLTSGGAKSKTFSDKLRNFLNVSSCELKFFITWISSIDSFGERENLVIQSLFKSHPTACLIIVSNSFDSKKGNQTLIPFLLKGFKLIAIKPDFDYIFKNTYAETWFQNLKKGHIDPGEVSIGQNLSNLLRLALLYKYGGIYIDTDVIILKSFSKLRNVIGAQTMDLETKKWSRLNNAVLIFDEKHPLVEKFIQEFALTFDGNKWGHNGPYLVSRVVKRVSERGGFGNFTVLPPSGFYPVDWSRISGFFRGPRDDVTHKKWLRNKLEYVRRESFGIHLWNRQSKKLRVEELSIIDQVMSKCCIFSNTSSYNQSL